MIGSGHYLDTPRASLRCRKGETICLKKDAMHNKWYPWPLISALALFLFAWAGYAAVWGGAAIATARFDAPGFSESAAVLEPIYIHSLKPDWRKSSRIGKAYPSRDGVVVIALYPDVFDRDIDTVNFVMVDASLKLLWQLTPESDRLNAERSVQRLVRKTLTNLETTLTSDAFKKKYQKQFSEIINDAALSALEEPDTKEALDVAFNELLGAFGQEFASEYLKLLSQKSMRIMDTLFENFTRNILKFKKGGTLDFDLIRAAIEEIMADPLLKIAVKRRLKEFVSTEAAAALSITFGRRFIANVYSDPRLFDLLAGLMADLAFTNDLRNIELAAAKSIREVVLKVLTRGNTKMDPIAAAILKNAFIEGRDKLVLMLTDQQLEKLSRENSLTFKPLVRL